MERKKERKRERKVVGALELVNNERKDPAPVIFFHLCSSIFSLRRVNQGISRGGELNCLSLSLWTLEGLLVLVHRASIIRSASKLGTRSLGKGSRWR